MTRSDLPLNQIVPVARPLDSFIQPARPNVTEPLRPQMMPEPTGLRILPQGTGGNVQGVNQFAELAQALQPFSENLIGLAGMGMKLYATNEYEKGRSEAMRAQVLANQQMLASGAEYAAENRKLDRVDPIGAMMMDRVNPFRTAGRQNALARVAGTEIQRAVLNAYRTAPGAAELPLESPALMQLHAQAVEGVIKKYQLDSGSPGFIEHVLPEIGQAQQKLYELHADHHSKFLKDTAWRQSAVEAIGIYTKARQNGVVEWKEYDPATGRVMQRVARLDQDPAGWEQGIRMLFRQTANRLANETGITGETSKMQEQMYQRIAEIAEATGNRELRKLLLTTPAGSPDKEGRVQTVWSLYGIDILEGSNRVGQSLWQQQQRQTEQGLQQFESELASITYGMADGGARGAAIQGLLDKYQKQGVPLGKLMESTQRMSKTLDEVGGRSYSTAGVDSLLQDFQGRVGNSWNAAQADQQFESGLSSIAPAERDEYRRRYAEIRRAKEREKDDMPSHLIDPLISAKMKSSLRTSYPGTATEAALRGADISTMLAWGDANVAESSRRQLVAYRAHVYNRIQEATTKKGAKLSASEVTQVAARALEEYGQKDQKAREYLFPGVGEEPSVGGRMQPPATGQRSSSGGQPAATPPPVFSSGQLDNMPNRANRLKAGEVVMDLPSVQEEVTRMMNGRPPSAAAMRAARDAGFGGNVGRWLMQQADGYRDSFRIPDSARQRLLRSSRDAEGMSNAIAATMRPVAGAVELAGRSLLDALMGVTPTYAAPMMVMTGGGGGGMNSLLAMLRSGEGGWNSVNRGGAGDTPGGIGTITNRSISSLEQMQSRGQVFAVGAYQFTPGVLARARREAGLPANAPFTPENQNRMAMALVLGSKRPALAAYITGKSDNLNAAHRDIALEWASLEGPSGRGMYDGDKAGNRASVTASRVRAMLQQARREYLSGRRP
jgi:hypothetical protein